MEPDLHTSNKSILDEATFKAQYIAAYCANWAVAEQHSPWWTGEPRQHKGLMDAPVEDAGFLANCAWQAVLDKL